MTEVGENVWVRGARVRRCLQMDHGLLRVPHAAERDTEEVQRIAIVRLPGDRLPEERRRFGKAPLLLQSVALRQLSGGIPGAHAGNPPPPVDTGSECRSLIVPA